MNLEDQIQTGHLLLETRVCRVCNEDKNLLNDFYLSRKDPTLKSSYSYECKECCIQRTIKYNHSHRPKREDQALQRHYGIGLEDYNKLFEEQNGSCAICGTTTPGGKWKNFHVDHCHDTDKVRGLLCSNCNTSMGLCKESIHTLQAMIQYLESHEQDRHSGDECSPLT